MKNNLCGLPRIWLHVETGRYLSRHNVAGVLPERAPTREVQLLSVIAKFLLDSSLGDSLSRL
jgi:hypothetical protein